MIKACTVYIHNMQPFHYTTDLDIERVPAYIAIRVHVHVYGYSLKVELLSALPCRNREEESRVRLQWQRKYQGSLGYC